MPVLVDVFANRSIGWCSLKFPYNQKAKDAIKALPGSRWIDPDSGPNMFDDGVSAMIRDAFDWRGKAWYVPIELLPILERDSNFKLVVDRDAPRNIEIDPSFADRFKPYQIEGAKRCVERAGYLLTFEPRVGKTAPAIAAACTLLAAGEIDVVIVLYPNNVAGEWERQLPEWAGVNLHRLMSYDPLLTMEVNKLRETPYLFVGCHYEILARREKCLARLVNGRRYGIIGDEIQMCQNRKSGRYQTFRRLSLGSPIIADSDVPGDELHASGQCVSRIGLTGTEMRNRPRNLFGPIDLIRPGYFGYYWSGYAKRFCDSREVNGHWVDKPTKVGKEIVCKGSSNEAELRERLGLVSMKVTRAEAAPWLPTIDRKVVLCLVPKEMLSKYKKLEQAYGKRITNALEGSEASSTDEAMIAEMDRATSAAKMDHAIKQCLEHLDRGVKVRISAHHHETVREFTDRFDAYFDEDHPLRLYPAFRAAGYDSQADRNEAIKRWKDYVGAALLITNNLSTGVGIDLSDGKVSISLEPEYVPADQMQWEDRSVDVHHGKTVEPPLVIYLLVKGTLDEHKVAALISKLKTIKAVVGAGTETDAMANAFRDSGVVDNSRLGLQDDSKSTAAAALSALRERLLRGDAANEATSLEAEMAGWEDDEDANDGEE